MRYSNIIEDMVWSYSRIKSFYSCPYGFFLKYIRHLPSGRQFFSSYGKLMHSILEQHLLGMLGKEELVPYYLDRFKPSVGKPPTLAIFKSYFSQGHDYLASLDFPHKSILAVEKKLDFDICGKPFVGVLDYESDDSGVFVIGDHKSRTLKPRTGRKKPTQSDLELDEYLRQLYTYSIPFEQKYGRPPDFLEFNCFRSGAVIREPFIPEKLEETKEWAVSSIEHITNNEDWSPQMDYWKCRYLCDQNQNCEYFKLNQR